MAYRIEVNRKWNEINLDWYTRDSDANYAYKSPVESEITFIDDDDLIDQLIKLFRHYVRPTDRVSWSDDMTVAWIV